MAGFDSRRSTSAGVKGDAESVTMEVVSAVLIDCIVGSYARILYSVGSGASALGDGMDESKGVTGVSAVISLATSFGSADNADLRSTSLFWAGNHLADYLIYAREITYLPENLYLPAQSDEPWQ